MRTSVALALALGLAVATAIQLAPGTAEAAAPTVADGTVDALPASAVAEQAGLVLDTSTAGTGGAAAGSTYDATVRIRTTTPPVNGEIVAVESAGSASTEHATAFALTDTEWTTISTTVLTDLAGSRLSLSVHVFDGGELEVQSSSLVPQAPAGWVLVENVDLSSPAGWVLDQGTASNTASQDQPENVAFGPDGLTIVGTRGGATNGSAYTSGDAKGTGHPIPNYARVEVVGRGPSAAGLWPCVLWLRPLVGSDGEIDLMENFGGQPFAKATLHNEYGATHAMIGETLPWSALADQDPAALHRYVMEKTPNRIKIWVDGVLMMDASPADAPDGFDWARIFENPNQQWYPRVTLQIGCGTQNPTCATGSPAASFTQTDMQVTELRIYAPAS